MSRLLEVRSVMRRACKYDLFTGDLDYLKGKQAVKENTTIFCRDPKTGTFTGPKMIYNNFVELYCKMQFGEIGVIDAVPTVVTNEILFELVLREATLEDLKDTLRHIKLHRIYYTYEGVLLGPFYTDNGTTCSYLENLVAKNQIFVPNERQHFKKKEMKMAG